MSDSVWPLADLVSPIFVALSVVSLVVGDAFVATWFALVAIQVTLLQFLFEFREAERND